MEGERPAILLRQESETLHRRAFEALGNDLIETEDAPLPRPVAIGEGNRRRIDRGHRGRGPLPRGPVAGATILGLKGRRAAKVRAGRGRQRTQATGRAWCRERVCKYG